jgi:hypothetical protein
MGKHGDKKKKKTVPPPDSFRARKAGCKCGAYVVKPATPVYEMHIDCPVHGFLVKRTKEMHEKFQGVKTNWTKISKPRRVWEWEYPELKERQ